MKSLAFWRRHLPAVDLAETKRHWARATAVDKRADRLIEQERRIIRENHLAPRIAAALKERHT